MAEICHRGVAKATYSVIIPTKDGERLLDVTVNSILTQSRQPEKIVIVDDASKEPTKEVLEKLRLESPKICIVQLKHNEPYNFNRVPKLINLATKQLQGKEQFILLSGDDTFYPNNYVEILLKKFGLNGKLRIASGQMFGIVNAGTKPAPHGTGRLIEGEFFRGSIPFPTNPSWESGILEKAIDLKFKIELFPEVCFKHLRAYSNYSIRTFGHGCYVLDHWSFYVFLRFLAYLFTVKRTVLKRTQAFYFLLGYIEYCLTRPAKDPKTEAKIAQKQVIMNFVRRVIRKALRRT